MAAISSLSISSSVYSQLQQQQAKRTADQAEQTARDLQSKASQARAAANQAQQNARTLEVKSDQAQGNAETAKRNVVALKSVGETQTQISALRDQIASVIAPTESAATTAAPVVNALGEQTGTLVNVTA